MYIKISNFKDKYGHEPKVLILNNIYYNESACILNNISSVYPYLVNFNLLFSNRVDNNDFELY